MFDKYLQICNYKNQQNIEYIPDFYLLSHIKERPPYKEITYITREKAYEFMEKKKKGIILTEEWLLKFGLKPNQWFCSNSYCVVEDKTGDIHYGWCMKTQNSLHTKEIEFGYFKYVHQFQNLYFAIIGEELILKE
jgi:hypothetical protein